MPLTEAQELFTLFFAIYFAIIIDRSHEMYKPWDTYNAWRGISHNRRRLLVAWAILFAIPLLHFALLFILLGSVNIRFDMTIGGISNVVLISLSSFFDFGYFRIYEAFLHSRFSGEAHIASLCICFGNTDPICLYIYYYSCIESSLYSRIKANLYSCIEANLYSCTEARLHAMPGRSSSRVPQRLS